MHLHFAYRTNYSHDLISTGIGYGWFSDGGIIVPFKSFKPIPESYTYTGHWFCANVRMMIYSASL